MTPAQIQAFLDANLHRFDMPQQYLGDEPNAVNKPWDDTTIRWLITASWPYEAAAGNSSIPTVYKAINDYSPSFLADRFYLPATPRDLKTLNRHRVPVFGIESKHPANDFDVVATSIAYPVLIFSFVKMLSISNIPPRRSVRQESPNDHPFVMIGGQAYAAPEFLAPVADCIWLGEAEDEPNNPGIGAVTEHIAQLKATQRWSTDRMACYEELARTYKFLYFPHLIDVKYHYVSKPTLEQPSKQVSHYSPTIPDYELPLTKRFVHDLNAIPPLDAPPLLYADPAMGAGDVVAARGCPAWCSFCALCVAGDSQVVTRDGVFPISELVGGMQEVWTAQGWQKAEIAQYGSAPLNTITFAPADHSGLGHSEVCKYGHSRTTDGAVDARGGCRECLRIKARNKYYRKTGRDDRVEELVALPDWKRQRGWRALPRTQYTVVHRATKDHRWPLVDGSITHDLQVGDFVMAQRVDESELGWEFAAGMVHGFIFGDGSVARTTHAGKAYAVGVYGHKIERMERYFRMFLAEDQKYLRDAVSGIQVRRYGPAVPTGPQMVPRVRAYIVTDISLKEFPNAVSPQYAKGFLNGWIAADGTSTSGSQSVRLDSSHPQAQEWLTRYAAFGGWNLVAVRVSSVLSTNYGDRSAPLLSFTLSQAEVAWKVVSIEKGTDEQPVFCATVPEAGLWTLGTGVYTGNTYREKPYRQRSTEYLTTYAQTLRSNMGSTRIVPIAPDFPMHTAKKGLFKSLIENVSSEVDAGAMRVDDFIEDPGFILLQIHSGLDDVTLGVEGNSQRMRDLVGKGTSDQDIVEAVARGIRAGIRKFKLFMISSLPSETHEDVRRILNLAQALATLRDNLGQPNVRIQFSWTPLLIEANTPMQWFAPTQAWTEMRDVLDEFKDLKIEGKIGQKTEPNKLAFFQACNRASREVGEALMDAMVEADTACWGGVPRNLKERITHHLIQHGFHNGLGDIFDERTKTDLFGWEFIDQGISQDLMWTIYEQMREFAQETTSATYDDQVSDPRLHGNEWAARCDSQCMGNTCGVCDDRDLRLRRDYMAAKALDTDVDLAAVRVKDDYSTAVKVRARLTKTEQYRFVGNDHWRFNLRRAAYRAADELISQVPPSEVETSPPSPQRPRDAVKPFSIAKRSIRFVSDDVTYRDWTAGTDYVEFGLTRRLSPDELSAFMERLNHHLTNADGSRWLTITDWRLHPSESTHVRRDVGESLWEVEVDLPPKALESALTAFTEASYVKLVLKPDGRIMFAAPPQEVNAKDFCSAVWLVRRGHRMFLRMMLSGRPSAYEIATVVLGLNSWLDLAKYPATRIEAFLTADDSQWDFFRVECQDCARVIPYTILEQPYDPKRCPRCLDLSTGSIWNVSQITTSTP